LLVVSLSHIGAMVTCYWCLFKFGFISIIPLSPNSPLSSRSLNRCMIGYSPTGLYVLQMVLVCSSDCWLCYGVGRPADVVVLRVLFPDKLCTVFLRPFFIFCLFCELFSVPCCSEF